jgi:hypothetical protein
MIQWGLRKGTAERMNVRQSERLAGEKILVPKGQLFLSFARRTSKQPEHFKSMLAEYSPLSSTFLHLHPFGLPDLGFVPAVALWQ